MSTITAQEAQEAEARWEWLPIPEQYFYTEDHVDASIMVEERDWVLEIDVAGLRISGDLRMVSQDAGELKVLGLRLVEQFLAVEKGFRS